MNQISTAWNACSAEIKNWLIRQPDVKVESLTSWLLPNLALKSNAIKYKQLPYSAAGQSRVADWEWWFVFSNTSSFAAPGYWQKDWHRPLIIIPVLLQLIMGNRRLMSCWMPARRMAMPPSMFYTARMITILLSVKMVSVRTGFFMSKPTNFGVNL